MNSEEFDIRKYLKLLQKRRWTVVSVFLAVVILVTAANFTMTPIYQATAKVYVDPGLAEQYAIQQQTYGGYQDDTTYLQTQIAILRSEAIARKVITKLGLNNSKGEGGSLSVDDCIGGFLGGLTVSVEKNSNIIKVSYEDSNPVLAANVANAVVETYVEQNLEMKVAPAKEAMKWLNDKLAEIKSSMEKSSSNIQNFKHEQGLIETGAKQSNISLQALSDLSSKALAAEARRYEAENKYRQVKNLANNPEGLMTLPAVINDRVIQDLKVQQSTLNKQIAEQSKKFGEKHPQMIRLKNEMDTLNRQIKNEVDLIVAALKNDYDESLRTEQSLKNALAQQKAEAMSYEKRSSEYDLMMQDVEGSRDIYNAVLKKFQESNIMGTISMSNVQLLDRAMTPKSPVRPQRYKNILIGIFFGSFMGVGFAFLIETFDNTYKYSEDIEEHLGLPFLGVVPAYKPLRGKHSPDSRIVVEDQLSHMAEFFRSIRGNIMLATGSNPKVLQVCSALRSEGKSLVSVNLACIMASAGEKVLLIDGDLRKPVMHKSFGLPNGQGLTSLLTNQSGLDSVLKQTKIPNLSIITSGPISPNPGELLGSKAMMDAVNGFREKYDRIIIDCPPTMGIADASFLTPVTDGVVLVIRSGKTPKSLAIQMKKGFEAIKAKVIGVVLNDTSSRTGSHHYYYYYSYNYSRYGQKGGKSKKGARESLAGNPPVS